jgi:two-component system C4-dicarboxylate transport response regulator DctD
MASFLKEAAQRYNRPLANWTPADLARWTTHDWPGNVRELKNIADRWALGLGDALTSITLPATSGSLSCQVDVAEKQIIETALRQCAGNVAQAAELLQTPKKTLYDKLTRHAIQPEAFRR